MDQNGYTYRRTVTISPDGSVCDDIWKVRVGYMVTWRLYNGARRLRCDHKIGDHMDIGIYGMLKRHKDDIYPKL